MSFEKIKLSKNENIELRPTYYREYAYQLSKTSLRNPLIGNCFFLIKYIDEWGTGTNRIIEACIKHGLPEPLFEYVVEDFVVTLRKSKLTEEYLLSQKFNER